MILKGMCDSNPYMKGKYTPSDYFTDAFMATNITTYIAQKDTKVITLPIGYADGVARSLSGKITATLNGKPIKQIGRITMDQMMFEANDVDCAIGDIVTLIGEENKYDNIDSWAKKLNTINYELTCRLKMRLPRIYVR